MLLLIQHIRYSFSMHIQFHQHFMLNIKTGNINFVDGETYNRTIDVFPKSQKITEYVIVHNILLSAFEVRYWLGKNSSLKMQRSLHYWQNEVRSILFSLQLFVGEVSQTVDHGVDFQLPSWQSEEIWACLEEIMSTHMKNVFEILTIQKKRIVVKYSDRSKKTAKRGEIKKWKTEKDTNGKGGWRRVRRKCQIRKEHNRNVKKRTSVVQISIFSTKTFLLHRGK